MKLIRRSMTLALFVLLLAGCSAKTSAPQPSGPLTTPIPVETQGSPSPSEPTAPSLPSELPVSSPQATEPTVAPSASGASAPSFSPAPPSENPLPSPVENEIPTDPGTVLLTFADGTQRTGHSADDDVTVEIPGKGGAQLLFHLSAEELDWAETVEFQQVSVRFGGSEWEHPGELFYNREMQELQFTPHSSGAQAYTYYNGEVTAFLLQNKDFANPEVLSYVDQVLNADKVTLRCWLSNGSGPCPLSMGDYKERVRSIFAGYEWKPLEEPLPSPDWTPEQWSIQLLNDNMNVCLSASNAQDQLTFSFSGNESEGKHYTAEGAAELCSRLADLYPGPEARLLLTTVPSDSITGDRELAAAYAVAFEELYLASGRISNFELHSVEPLPVDPLDSVYRHVLIDFSVTPTNLADPYWSRLSPQSDGRYRFNLDVSLLLYENGVYRGDWFQSPDLIL